MQDAIAIVSQIIDEHTVLRRRLKLAGDTVSDQEALLDIARQSSGWDSKQRGELENRQKDLERTLHMLAAGLKNHFAFEEERLPLLFGVLVVRGIAVEHRGIRERIERAIAVVSGLDFGRMAESEIPGAVLQAKEALNDLGQAIEKHAGKETVLIELAQEAIGDGLPLREENVTWDP